MHGKSPAVVSADSRLLMAGAGSSRVRSVGPRGYLPLLKESAWTGSGQDSITG
jgi:hypothetical protein